jgi:uncharacterized glyoxalase superfamily protein PhnB
MDKVESLYQTAVAQGFTPAAPQNGAWGERYVHRTDPNGHELSFAQRLPSTAIKESLRSAKEKSSK